MSTPETPPEGTQEPSRGFKGKDFDAEVRRVRAEQAKAQRRGRHRRKPKTGLPGLMSGAAKVSFRRAGGRQ